MNEPKPTDVQEEILARTVRIETKLTKLLAHVGLNADGTTPQKVDCTTPDPWADWPPYR